MRSAVEVLAHIPLCLSVTSGIVLYRRPILNSHKLKRVSCYALSLLLFTLRLSLRYLYLYDSALLSYTGAFLLPKTDRAAPEKVATRSRNMAVCAFGT